MVKKIVLFIFFVFGVFLVSGFSNEVNAQQSCRVSTAQWRTSSGLTNSDFDVTSTSALYDTAIYTRDCASPNDNTYAYKLNAVEINKSKAAIGSEFTVSGSMGQSGTVPKSFTFSSNVFYTPKTTLQKGYKYRVCVIDGNLAQDVCSGWAIFAPDSDSGSSSTSNCEIDFNASVWRQGSTVISDPNGGAHKAGQNYTFSANFKGSGCAGKTFKKKTNRLNADNTEFSFDVVSNVKVNSNYATNTQDFTSRLDYKTKYRMCFTFGSDSEYKCGGYITMATGNNLPAGGGTNTGGTTPPTGGGTPGGVINKNSSDGVPTDRLWNPISSNNLGELMLTVMKGFIILIAAWAVMFIVVGGVRMVMSQGNSEAITKAKQTITWAIAGVIVSLLAFSIVSIVQNILGANPPTPVIGGVTTCPDGDLPINGKCSDGSDAPQY